MRVSHIEPAKFKCDPLCRVSLSEVTDEGILAAEVELVVRTLKLPKVDVESVDVVEEVMH